LNPRTLLQYAAVVPVGPQVLAAAPLSYPFASESLLEKVSVSLLEQEMMLLIISLNKFHRLYKEYLSNKIMGCNIA